MLRLVLSTDWIAGRERILQYVAEDVRARRGNRILMVPELISHDTERRLCTAAGDTASRYAEVLSFPRLLRRVSEQTQFMPPECLDNGGRLTAMAAATRQLSSKLNPMPRWRRGRSSSRACWTPWMNSSAAASAPRT